MKMDSTLKKLAITETYEEVKDLIFQHCWAFHKKTGIEFDELNSQANLIFMQLLESYQEDIAKLTTYLSFVLPRRLYDYYNDYLIRNSLFIPYIPDDHRLIMFHPQEFPVNEFLEDLSYDCQIIFHLIMKTPKEVQDMAFNKKQGQMLFKEYLASILETQFNWTPYKIKNQFKIMKDIVNAI